ncbi:Uu.00g132510.m01.CDS01 [Anthostomella pinea]|uniref:Uu.00g132510.m01.CDS01 n=1 Tax=Anthostomella pinea TaxID=933095 RepID=A0AAI8VDS8_9PEZI|nr:Uu.00g132510.m01.CDS01 [Anthostomella pinea]
MSEYWKSTPKYWCKHCTTYVRDTKLERTNHEATAKHQSGLKRFLRDLHRGHDQEQREKDRAKREIERLNGVVAGTSTSASSTSGPIPPPAPTPASSSAVTNAQRQKQWEQLADLGIDVPTELRRDMAMASEWTVTNTRVIDHTPKTDDPEAKPEKVDAIATGVRKRTKPEGAEEAEEEDVIKGLFKKPRKWGRDTREAPADEADLDALLNTTLIRPVKKEEDGNDSQPPVKQERPTVVKREDLVEVEVEVEAEAEAKVLSHAPPVAVDGIDATPIKREAGTETEAPTVVFKKRKPKQVRQK